MEMPICRGWVLEAIREVSARNARFTAIHNVYVVESQTLWGQRLSGKGSLLIKRKRSQSGTFFELEQEIEQLIQENNQLFKKCLPVYGHYDIVLPIEHASLYGIHHAVNTIQARCRDSIFSTITCIATHPEFDNPNRYHPDSQVCVGIHTKLGTQDNVRNRLEALPDFDLADVVFGEFDIIALFNPKKLGAVAVLRDAIRTIQDIQKTTTMLPQNLRDM